jgi:ankyrin repeat protein
LSAGHGGEGVAGGSGGTYRGALAPADPAADAPEAKVGHDDTLLMEAAYHGHVSCAELLLDRGAAVDDVDEGGRTALHMAASKGHLEVIDLLIARGADPALPNEWGDTPLMLASWERRDEAVSRLLQIPRVIPKIDQQNQVKKTALLLACERGVPGVVSLLLQHGVDFRLGDEHRDTPLAMAREYCKDRALRRRRKECARLLEVSLALAGFTVH